jgi:hypothetical protein
MINVNIMRHGDGKRVYVTVRTDDGEYVVSGDRIAVNIDPALPDVSDPVSQVGISHNPDALARKAMSR